MIMKRGKGPLKTEVWKAVAIALLLATLVATFALPAMAADPNLYIANWLKSPTTPVLQVGSAGSWDEAGVGVSCVIYDNEESKYKMWYTGYNESDLLQIGYATSTLGVSWTKYTKTTTNDGGPVLTPGTATGLTPVEPVDLRTTANFVILAATTITDANLCAITGNIGLSPGPGTAVLVTCPEMQGGGKIYTVDANYVGADMTCVAPGPGANKTIVDLAIDDMITWAYTDAAGRAPTYTPELYEGHLGGKTLYPGVYKWSTSVDIAGQNLTLDAQGNSGAVWIFEIEGDLDIASLGSVESGIKVELIGGAEASNVFWQVAGPGTGTTLGTYSTFNGTILCLKQIRIQHGAVLNGRALSQTQVTLDANTINDSGTPTAGGVSTAWDAKGVGSPCVIKVAVGDYRMWYTGYKLDEVSGAKVPRIGYATSTDGIAWTRGNSSQPVLTPGSGGAWDNKGVHSAWVIYDTQETKYKMWYTGRTGASLIGNSAIGYATSTLGESWTKYDTTGGPVLTAGASGAWDDSGVSVANVIKANSKYTVWYTGYSDVTKAAITVAIGVAQSTGGITGWTKNPLPVLRKETSGSDWNAFSVGAPRVLEASSTKLVMWYSGIDTNLVPQVGVAAVDTTTFNGSAILQGGSRPDPGGYVIPLTLKLYDSTVTLDDDNILTATPMFTFSTAGGTLTITGHTHSTKTIYFTASVPSGSYWATLFTTHALINMKQVVITAPTSTVSMGTLLEGNADDSVQITGADFALLLNDYLAVPSGPGSTKWNSGRCDFDRSLQVTSIDFSLLTLNYNELSPKTVS